MHLLHCLHCAHCRWHTSTAMITLDKNCRRLYAEDGRFEVGNIQDWQHSAMYAAFLLSGLVDLLGHTLPDGTLPEGVEHVRAR